jgi:hypothetical protein
MLVSNARIVPVAARLALAALLGAAVLLVPVASRAMPAALAPSGTGYTLAGSRVGAGLTVFGGSYQLDAAIGDPGAGVASGGAYTLDAGFLAGLGAGAPPPQWQRIYLPAIIKAGP